MFACSSSKTEAAASATEGAPCYPPLQTFTRLVASQSQGGAAVAQLQEYFNSKCCCLPHLQVVQRGPNTSSFMSINQNEITNRATQLSTSMRTQMLSEYEVGKSLAEQITSDLNERFPGKSFKRFLPASAGGTAAADASLLSPLLVLNNTPNNTAQAGVVGFQTLSAAATLAQGVLSDMKGHVAVRGVHDLNQVLDAGLSFLNTNVQTRTHMCLVFAVLEVFRHYVAYMFGSCHASSVVHAVEKLDRQERTFEDAVAMIAELNEYIDYSRSHQQSTEHAVRLRDECLRLLTEYSVFFNVMAGTAAGVQGDFASFAASFNPTDGALYGMTRFPCLKQILFKHLSDGKTRVQHVPSNFHGRLDKAICPVTATSKSSSAVLPSRTMNFMPYLQRYVVDVIAPAETFAALLILSAVSSLSFTAVLNSVVGVVEIQALYEKSPVLLKLVKALWGGDFGGVWTCALQAAKQYFTNEPLFNEHQGNLILSSVKESLCFQYISLREYVDCQRAAAELGLTDSAEFMDVAAALICSGKLSARISLVDQSISLVTDTTAADAAGALDTVLRGNSGAVAKMEHELRLLAVQREFVSSSFFERAVASARVMR